MWGTRSGVRLKAAKTPSQALLVTNRVFLNARELDRLAPGRAEALIEVGDWVYAARAHEAVPPGAVALNSLQRRDLRVALDDELLVNAVKADVATASAVSTEVDLVLRAPDVVEVDGDELAKLTGESLRGLVVSSGQTFVVEYYGQSLSSTKLSLRVSSAMTSEPVKRAKVGDGTVFSFTKAPSSKLRVRGGEAQRREIFRADFNFESMGIGGLDSEFSQIFRRAFASRVFPPDVIKKLGIAHVKGMLLYGPPGTGKTLIARQIGKMLNGKEPKVVNGPEILNKYVGQSEENVRKLFADAEVEYAERGEASELHIIIFDEMDAICKQRGSARDGTGVHDTIVNQLLSKIDGVNALNNILIIGMTNRKDLIDEAILRPGRLEMHVEISLPDEHGRQQILRIHTASMRANNLLADDVNLDEVARRTKNYSGAEIEGLCKSAAAFALNRHVDFRDIHKPLDSSGVVVRQDDFNSALGEVEPAFGVGRDDFERTLLGGFITHGLRMQRLVDAGTTFRNEVQTSQRNPLLSVLIAGAPGTGKSALAAKLAIESGFPFVRMIKPDQFIGFSEYSKCAALAKAFDDAHKSPLSVLILDDMERIFEYAPIGPRFANLLLQTILVLIKGVPPKGRRLLILATTSSLTTMEELDVKGAFNAVLTTPTLDEHEIEQIVDGQAPVDVLASASSAEGSSLVPSSLQPFRFSSRQERDQSTELLAGMQVGIKKLLMVLEMAKIEAPDGSRVLQLNRLKEVLRDVN